MYCIPASSACKNDDTWSAHSRKPVKKRKPPEGGQLKVIFVIIFIVILLSLRSFSASPKPWSSDKGFPLHIEILLAQPEL